MLLSEAITRVADDTNVNSSITSVNSRLIRSINRACQEIWNSFRWSFRWRNYRIVTDVDFITNNPNATVTVANGSYLVTMANGSFIPAHVGWHIDFPQDTVNNWYKIAYYISSSQVYLDVPYQGTLTSGAQFDLRHFDYILPTEPWDLGAIIVTHDRSPVRILEPTSIEIVGPVPYFKGYPLAVSIYSSTGMPSGGLNTYTAGTVSGSTGSTQLTGVGTTWQGNIYPGDQIVIAGDTNTYSVATVDTNTKITLYQNLQTTPAMATYTITKYFQRVMRVMWPSTNNYTLDIRALRLYQNLIDTNDTNELLYRLPNAVILKAEAMEFKNQGDQYWTSIEQQAEQAIMRAKAEDDALTSRDSITGVLTYRYDRRRWYKGDIT